MDKEDKRKVLVFEERQRNQIINKKQAKKMDIMLKHKIRKHIASKKEKRSYYINILVSCNKKKKSYSKIYLIYLKYICFRTKR